MEEKVILRVAGYIHNNSNTYAREISKELKLSTSVVSNAIRKIDYFIERKDLNEILQPHAKDVPLPRLPILLNLKKGTTPDKIKRYLRLKL